MTESNTYLAELLCRLQDDQLPLVDFDRLKESLESLMADTSAGASAQREAELYRKDYEARITGMMKALALAGRRKSGREGAKVEAESLMGMGAEDLIACYRLTAARFRDAFPASFGYLNGAGSSRTERLAAYKS